MDETTAQNPIKSPSQDLDSPVLCLTLSKWKLLTGMFNTLVILAGFGVILFGVSLLSKCEGYPLSTLLNGLTEFNVLTIPPLWDLHVPFSTYAYLGLVVLGGVVLLISGCGIVVIHGKRRCLISMHILGALIFSAILGYGVIGLSMMSNQLDILIRTWTDDLKGFDKYGVNNEEAANVSSLIDALQTNFSCCGIVDGMSDYASSVCFTNLTVARSQVCVHDMVTQDDQVLSVPRSCCVDPTANDCGMITKARGLMEPRRPAAGAPVWTVVRLG